MSLQGSRERMVRARQELLENQAGAVRGLLSADGAELLAYLEEKFFNTDLVGDDVQETYFNLGAREVVVQMKLLRALALRSKEK